MDKPTDPQLGESDFRYCVYCVYCGADCWPPPDEREHAADCPSVTGLWRVIEQDFLPDGRGMACTDCAATFKLGDFYVLRDVESGEIITSPAAMSISEPVCVGCGAATEITNAR